MPFPLSKAKATVSLLTLPNGLVLLLAVIGGVLEYLNQQTFGFDSTWREVFAYGVLAITAFGVSIPVGQELGVDIETLLNLPTYVVVLLTTIAYVLAAAVTTFGIGGVWKGVILGTVAFITTVFGPAPTVPLPPAS